jgi:dihydrofolate reductase
MGNRIVLLMSVSVDGYFEGPDHDIGWHRVDDELHRHLNDRLRGAGGFLHGRVSYELMASYWPTADQDPDASPTVVEFARIWREMPKVVYTRTLTEAGWNARVVRDVVPAEVRELAARAGDDLYVGGALLAAAFREHHLIDEYLLYVHPVVLGAGRPLFPAGSTAQPLLLFSSRAFGNGVVELHYGRG